LPVRSKEEEEEIYKLELLLDALEFTLLNDDTISAAVASALVSVVEERFCHKFKKAERSERQ